MAKKVIIVDDIDGTEGDGVVTQRFSLGSDFQRCHRKQTTGRHRVVDQR